MKKRDTASRGTSEWTSASKGRITPTDIQQKEFQVARFGAGYRMREVDEFLDQVTDALSALVAENERLLRGSGDPGAASKGAPVRPAADESDRAAVEAFLRREKGFLQDLGGLVQEHAEELRSMVRAARQSTLGPAAPREEPPVEPAAAAAPEAPVVAGGLDEPEASQGPTGDADEIDPTEQATDATDASSEGEIADGNDDDDQDASEGTMTVTETPSEEPIRLDEPQPARSGRKDEKEDGSLRELFWGEE
jgi:DivIVA domain-containing protein